ncbi:hypothetical protein VIN01S_26910 [Vibrio inusitatus NBRC 102082]|uniref:Uncharacterized protein n=1 Tax=Vibrio inusitatus NBRC 102082 TaxID=1219070 RepID=A0A4Y3HXS4_9VIBR|nr:hypothetical protein VIN01S_26910 [Vibrio inusitatus NBRC 102082]
MTTVWISEHHVVVSFPHVVSGNLLSARSSIGVLWDDVTISLVELVQTNSAQ